MSEASTEAWERARALVRTWNAQGLEAWAATAWSPEIVWHEPERFPDAGIHRGRDACLRRMRERFDWIGEVRMELVDVQQVPPRTMFEVIIHSKGRQSGARASQREFLVSEIDDGRTTLFLEFLDRDDAIAALTATSS
jgi:ketosteroid isomerase-like protein